MSTHRLLGSLVVGVLLVASCARTEVPPSSPAPRVAQEVDAGAVADRDGDGVPDDDDRCPDVPEDCDGFEDNDGCPDEDNDKDGRPDHCDQCPDIAAGTWNGCPHIILEVATIRIPIATTFAIDGVKPSIAADLLDPIVELAKQERMKRLGIVGHALKTEKNPASLALRRATATKDLLVARGVPAAKIELRAAPAGDLESCPPAEGGKAQPPCASFAAVEIEDHRMTWDGSRYLDPPPPPPPPPLPCPDPPPRGPGRPCKQP
jgi:outer membrane protein OmpA-like peptidoglycan-associated protein